MRTVRLLLVEDNSIDALLFRSSLTVKSEVRFDVTVAPTLRQALAELKTGLFELVLCDLNLPDAAGPEIVKGIAVACPRTPIVVLTGSDEELAIKDALAEGAQSFLLKGQIAWTALSRHLLDEIDRRPTG